ncbi:unnamed protein product [Prorocentrum cordatum]|uniref:Holocytochrome c-type synthase n=1 Tax=Prorocentrum cordatum TaxID=2364126 RepID=A0ABN9Q240_9DINO|nr:unnamed protein product [Polarella glacialis]
MGAANCSSCGCDSEQEKQNTTNIKPHHQSAQGYAGGPSSPPMGGPRGFDEGLSKSNMPDHPSHGDYGLKDPPAPGRAEQRHRACHPGGAGRA